MADLITTDYAVAFPVLKKLHAQTPTLLTTLISAVSQQIQRYCYRRFVQGNYTVYLSGPGVPYDTLILPENPVSHISRMAARPLGLLTIQNTLTTVNSRATVEVSTTGITLKTWANAVETDSPVLTFATYPTLQAMSTAIIAQGNGWTAQPMGGYGGYAAADIRIPEGAVSALAGVQLEVFTEDIPTWGSTAVSADGTGWTFTSQYGWRLDTATGIVKGVFPPGVLNIRVDYTGGFATIPDDVQMATAIQLQHVYRSLSVDFNLQSEKVGPYSKVVAEKGDISFHPIARSILSRYKNVDQLAYRMV